jgi:hypothetical protein
MRPILALLLVCALCGCQTRNYPYAAEFEDTRKIGSEEIAKLPGKLKYSELIKLWGPAVTADPFYLYQSKIDGVILGVFVAHEDSHPFQEKSLDGEILGMYFMDMREFRIHAWGRDILQEFKERLKSE